MKWFNGLGLNGYWGSDGSNNFTDSDISNGYPGGRTGDTPQLNDDGGFYNHNNSLNDFVAEEDPFAEFMDGARAFDTESHGLFFDEEQRAQQHMFRADAQTAADQPEGSLLTTRAEFQGDSGHGNASSGGQADIGIAQIAPYRPIHQPETSPPSPLSQPLTPTQTSSDEQGFHYHDLDGNSRRASAFSDHGELPIHISDVLTSNDAHKDNVTDLAPSTSEDHNHADSRYIPITVHALPLEVPKQQLPGTRPPSSRKPQPSLPCAECGTVPSTPCVSKCGHYHCPTCVKATKGSGGVSKCGACSDVYKTTKTPEQHETTGKKQTSKKFSPILPQQQSSKSKEVKAAPPKKSEDEKKFPVAKKAPKSEGNAPQGPLSPASNHLVRLTLHPNALKAVVLNPSTPSRWAETLQSTQPKEPDKPGKLKVNDNDALKTEYEAAKENPYKRKLAPAVSLEAPPPKKPRGTSAIEKRDTIKLQERAETLTAQIDRLKKQIDKLKQQNLKVVNTKQIAETQSNTRISKLETDVKNLKLELKDQKSDFKSSQMSQKSLRNTITEHNATINAQQAEITSLTEQLAVAAKAQDSKVDELLNKREGSFKGAYERERENVKKIRKLKTEFEDKFKTEKEEREKAEAEVLRLLTVIRSMQQA